MNIKGRVFFFLENEKVKKVDTLPDRLHLRHFVVLAIPRLFELNQPDRGAP